MRLVLGTLTCEELSVSVCFYFVCLPAVFAICQASLGIFMGIILDRRNKQIVISILREFVAPLDLSECEFDLHRRSPMTSLDSWHSCFVSELACPFFPSIKIFERDNTYHLDGLVCPCGVSDRVVADLISSFEYREYRGCVRA